MTWLAYDMQLIGPDFPEGKWHDVHCFAPIQTPAPNGVNQVLQDAVRS
jgi:hypothetical protein